MTRALLPLALLLGGCSDMTGIWLFEIPFQEDSTSCNETITENYNLGYVPEAGVAGGGPWVSSYDFTGSGSVAFGQIETYGDDSAVLIIGTTVFTGTKEQGNWVFTWTDESSSESKNEHYNNAGQVDYGYVRRDTTVSDVTYTFVLDGKDKADVTVDATSTSTTEWFESDLWSEEVRDYLGSTGDTPASAYLVYNEAGDVYSQQNTWDVTDCDNTRNGLCYLATQVSCSDSGDFVAYRTDFEDEDHFRSVRESGNGSSGGGGGGTDGFDGGGWDTGW